ncbi:MAG: ATP-binding cassette domain-containing protein [Anaerolinea sp.]|nr:ATP-binding cassette domain-containing protein [Anaerolinea sp.]
MINVTELKKSYGAVEALKGVSFSIAAGEIIGLLGPNGAGKTTIIKALTGYLQPDSGVIMVDGLDVLTQTQAVQERIGYLPENAPLYPELSVQAYLLMMAGLRQIPDVEIPARLSAAVHATGLADHLTRPIGQLSKGYRQRVGLAQAILHRPRLLILDEPTVGLDPTQIVEIRHLIRRLAQHSTILFSTHILPEVEALCDRVIILMRGEIKVDARLADLAGTNDAILALDDAVADAPDALRALAEVQQVTSLPPRQGQAAYHIQGTAGADLTPAIYRLAAAQGWPVRELRPDVQTLEMVFNKLAMAEA